MTGGGFEAAIDDEPLTRPADVGAVRDFIRQQKGYSRWGGIGAVGCAGVVVLVVGLLFAAAFAAGPLSGGSGWWWVGSGVVLALTLVLIGYLVRREIRSTRTGPELHWRLSEFFAANGVEPVSEIADPGYRSSVFAERCIRPRLVNVTRWFDDAVEVGEFHYLVAGYRGLQSPEQRGYARIPLSRSAPDLLLDAAANNAPWKSGALSNLADVRTPTKLRSADGARFTLWAWPRDLERATALADQEFVDLLGRFPVDLEITGGVAYLYWDAPLRFAEAERWRWIFAVADTLSARTAEDG